MDVAEAIEKLEAIAIKHGHGTTVYLEVANFRVGSGHKYTRWVAHQRGWKSYCSTFVGAVKALDDRLTERALLRRESAQ